MVASAEKKAPAHAAPRKEDLDVQNMINKHTRELKVGFLTSSEKNISKDIESLLLRRHK